ncbi:MAG: hypothetical protein Q9221_006777 [Calogaya cf. arnoldii]
MRLALQRLPTNSDGLRYLRSTLHAFDGIVELPTPGPCPVCRQRWTLGSARHYISLRSSLYDGSRNTPKHSSPEDGAANTRIHERPPLNVADNKTNRTKSESHHQSLMKEDSRMLNQNLEGRVASHRERVIWRFLDGSAGPHHFPVWLELAHTRRRVHGIKGVRLVWKAILERDVKLPTTGEAADGLWNHLLQLGFDDPDALKEIFIYARGLKEGHGRIWPKLYVVVVGHYLLQKPNRAWLCHMRLHKHFPPSNPQLRQLFRITMTDQKLCQLFLSMHGYFPQARIYDVAIPELCRHGLYATAVAWHKKMIDRKDLPSNARSTEPVMRYLAATGQKARLMEYTRLMVAAGVSFVPCNTQDMLVSPVVSPELLGLVGYDKEEVPQYGYSDKFCARLMATRFFSIETIIGTLGCLAIHEIGPLALRAMATRELLHNPYCSIIADRLDQLTNAGISTGSSTFSILVRRLAAEGQSHLLANIVSCDLHTDTFDDHKLQESLLLFYHENGDTMAFNRTMAILLARVPKGMVPARRWNIILRSYLSRRELQAVKDTIEKMQDLQIQIEPKSITYMSQTMLSLRQVGRRPPETKELGLLIRIWQDILRSGGLVPPWIWSEIFRRLGMSGHLVMFESLALWLAAWYSSPTYRTSLSSLLGQSEGDSKPLHPSMAIDLKPSNPLHPLYIIFAPTLQQAMVAWGFQHTFIVSQKRATRSQRPDWTWGLALLRKLRDSNVYIRHHTVSKAFKLRLIELFGPGKSKRKINRMIRRRNRDSLGIYVWRGKEIWGSDLLHRDRRWIGQSERIMIANSEIEKEYHS